MHGGEASGYGWLGFAAQKNQANETAESEGDNSSWQK